MIQDILRDVIKYVHGVGVFPAVKVDQTADGVTLSSTNAEKTVVLTATSKLKFSDTETTFGLGQLDLLQRLLDCPEYEENVSIGLGLEGDKLDRIEFANASGDFTNNYRLMSKALIETLVPPPSLLELSGLWTLLRHWQVCSVSTCKHPLTQVRPVLLSRL